MAVPERIPVPAPIARSAVSPVRPAVVAGWEVSGPPDPDGLTSAGLTLTDVSPVAKLAVRARPDGGMARALGVPLGRAARVSTAAPMAVPADLVIGSGPGEWLVLGRPGSAGTLAEGLAELSARVGGDEQVTVIDLTHGIALLRLTGQLAAVVLGALCGIDLGERQTPPGAAFRSLLAEVITGVVRDDQDGVPGSVQSYLLYCERSYGQYLFDAVLDAGAEFGIEVGAFRLPGI